MTMSIGRFLTEFAPFVPPPPLASPAPETAASSHRTEAQVIAAIEDAHCAGFKAGAADTAHAVARRESDLLASHAAELAAARAAWAEEEGARLATLLGARIDALGDGLAAAAAACLRHLLPRAVAAKAVADLTEAVGTLLTAADGAVIVVAGRTDLLQSLERALGGRPGLSFEPADLPDVTVTCGETTIRTRLQDWADRLATELASPA